MTLQRENMEVNWQKEKVNLSIAKSYLEQLEQVTDAVTFAALCHLIVLSLGFSLEHRR